MPPWDSLARYCVWGHVPGLDWVVYLKYREAYHVRDPFACRQSIYIFPENMLKLHIRSYHVLSFVAEGTHL